MIDRAAREAAYLRETPPGGRPEDLAAERALVGAILWAVVAWDELELELGDLYQERNRQILSAFLEHGPRFSERVDGLADYAIEVGDQRAPTRGVALSLARQVRAHSEARRQHQGLRRARPRRPMILVSTQIYDMTDEAERALAAGRHEVYHQAGELVRVVEQKGKIRPEPLPLPSLTEILSDVADWAQKTTVEKEGRQEERISPRMPPYSVCSSLHARGDWPLIPRLEGVVDSPTILADGSVLEDEGHDEASGLLYKPQDEFPPVPRSPTRQEARAAAGVLLDLVRDFPWVKESDKSAWLAALLTVVGRFMFEGNRPLFTVSAAEKGTGKSLLVDVLSIIAVGEDAPRMAQAKDPEEEGKRLLAIGREGKALGLIDNVERPLGSDVLALALTGRFSGRLLGSTRMIEVRTPILFATGNNLQVRGDLGRRVIPIDLLAEVENPEERSGFYYQDLLGHVRRERPRLLVAALTILRWHVIARQPPADLPPFGSFEAWSGLVRSCLVYLGLPDPCLGRRRIREAADPQREADTTFLEVWEEKFPAQMQITAKSLVKHAGSQRANGNPELSEAMAELHSRLDPAKLDARLVGGALKRLKNRILGGRRLRQSEKRTPSGFSWWVERAGVSDG